MKNFTFWSSRALGLILSIFALNAQAQFCDEAQGVPGFPSDPACEAAVCAADPFCCDTEWDGLCATTASGTPECSGCVNSTGGGTDCVATPSGGVTECDYDTNSPAYSIVIAEDAFCCDSFWDTLCQDAYEGLGGLPNPDPDCEFAGACTVIAPECATDQAAVDAVQDADEICCQVEWDDVCQALYDSLSDSCGGQLSPDDCSAEIPACVTDLTAYGLIVAIIPECCEIAWDATCQEVYDDLSNTCTGECVPTPDCVTDIAAYEAVILEDAFCCETEWDGLCQLSYDELSSTCLGSDGGCTYPTACNFNPAALFDDGSCEFTSCAGCTYPDALNFNPGAVFDDGSCVFDPSDCVDNCPGDFNNDNVVNTADLLTFLSVFGTVCEE